MGGRTTVPLERRPGESAARQSLGVDGGQGRLFGRPAPVDVLVEAGTGPAPEPFTA